MEVDSEGNVMLDMRIRRQLILDRKKSRRAAAMREWSRGPFWDSKTGRRFEPRYAGGNVPRIMPADPAASDPTPVPDVYDGVPANSDDIVPGVPPEEVDNDYWINESRQYTR